MSIQSAVGNLTEAVDKLTATTNVPASTLTTKVSNIQADQATAEATQTTAEGHVTTADGHVTDAQGYLTTTKSGAGYVTTDVDAVSFIDSASIPLTINDVFIYDTSEDSDGGAWRKRTQHTSWYNETLASGKWLGVHASESKARNAYATLGAEQVTNGTFDTDISGWTVTAGSGTASHVDGQLYLLNYVIVEQQPVTTGSGTFRLTWKQTLTRASHRTRIRIRNSADTADVGPFDYYYGSGEFSVEFSTTSGVTLQIYIENGHSAYFDNISVREITAQTTATGDYYQDSTNGYFYSLNASSGTTQIYRGARAEFPTVAALVATANGIVIYDVDDPAIPMWADWSNYTPVGNEFPILNYALSTSAVKALNGVIYGGGAANDPPNGGGLRKFNLIADTAELVSNAYGPNRGYFTEGLSRNYLTAYTDGTQPLRDSAAPVLPSAYVRDIAVGLRKSVPIDVTTGLPKPIVAIAHDLGASVFHENDTITSTTLTGTCYKIALSPDAEEIVTDHNGTSQSIFRYSVDDLTTAGFKAYYATYYFPRVFTQPLYVDFTYGEDASDMHVTYSYPYSEDYGYYQFKRGISNGAYDHSNDLYCRTEVEYLTGWMPSKTRVATLCGTDSDSLPSTHTVSVLATSTTDFSQAPWTASSTTTITNGNELTFGSLYGGISYPLFPATSTDYRAEHMGVLEIELDITHVSGTASNFSVYTADLHNNIVVFNLTANTRQTVTLQMYLRQRGRNENLTLQTRDGSGNWPTVIVHGWTVTQKPFVRNALPFEVVSTSFQNYTPIYIKGDTFIRSPVATGAELVGKDASGNSYLVRPYNPDLDFLQDVANDYTVMFWGAPTHDNAWSPFISMSNYNAASYCWWGVQGNKPAIGTSQIGTESIVPNQLYHFCFVNRGGTLYAYLNGKETGSITLNSTHAAPTNQSLVIGGRHANDGSDGPATIPDIRKFNQAALVKIAENAISAEQVQFIYEAERELFQENAACTLFTDPIPNDTLDYGLSSVVYGGSHTVKAVDYDSRTGVAHVVTSAGGRSSFKGLVRIDYSGTKWSYNAHAVDTSVAASNGLIIEG